MSCRKAFGKTSASLPNDIDFFVPDTGPLNAEAWKARLVTSNGTQQVKLPSSGVIVRYAYVSQRGCVTAPPPPPPPPSLSSPESAPSMSAGHWLSSLNTQPHSCASVRTSVRPLSMPTWRQAMGFSVTHLRCCLSHTPGCLAGDAARHVWPSPCCCARLFAAHTAPLPHRLH